MSDEKTTGNLTAKQAEALSQLREVMGEPERTAGQEEAKRFYVDYELSLFVSDVIEAKDAGEAKEIASRLLESEDFIRDLMARFAEAELLEENLERIHVTPADAADVTLTRAEIEGFCRDLRG